jgi:hypothetical protein
VPACPSCQPLVAMLDAAALELEILAHARPRGDRLWRKPGIRMVRA